MKYLVTCLFLIAGLSVSAQINVEEENFQKNTKIHYISLVKVNSNWAVSTGFDKYDKTASSKRLLINSNTEEPIKGNFPAVLNYLWNRGWEFDFETTEKTSGPSITYYHFKRR